MEKTTTVKDVIIIGAGASGLMCAARCGQRGRSVVVLDHASRASGAARKVLVSGGGRCNFTNRRMGHEHFFSQNPDFCRSALARFTPDDFLALLSAHRIRFIEEEEGKLFCAGGSRQIVSMLIRECEAAGCELRGGCKIEAVGKDHDGFRIETNQGLFRSASLVVATGGLSYPQLGATGLGHDIARRFGMGITPLRPALVPFTLGSGDRGLLSGLSGVSFSAALSSGNRTFRGGVLFTHRGLSGPAVLQASLYWDTGTPVMIDLLPDRDTDRLLLDKRTSRMELRTLLSGSLPKRLAAAWCESMGRSVPINQLPDRDLKEIARLLHAWSITPQGTEGYGTAEVTAGGVDTNGLSSRTMESRTIPGLYFIGEVLDVTGELGGYNLHWAWASGHAAGQYA